MHVQKTGGNTVRGMLNDVLPDPRNPRGDLPKHAHLGGILKAEPGLADYYVFGFVRNPWSRLVSWWSMIQDAKVNAEAGNEGAVERLRTNRFMRVVATSYDTFDEFVLRGPDDLPRLGTPQLRYLATSRGVEPGAYYELRVNSWNGIHCTCTCTVHRRRVHSESRARRLGCPNSRWD